MRYEFTINQALHSIDIPDPETPLVFVLRDWLGLKGTKYSCLEGVCGACTVHIDGQAVRACQLQAQDVAGASITTIEGLSTQSDHPVQQAWIEEQVAQCGWCQSGQIMQAAALLAETPNPSDADIAAGMGGNICRCGTGNRIKRAVARAADIGAEAAK
ncbi:MAG: (2Fe-2S)-binding protein [Rhodobacteraceae bacterium]|nr:(2Fe-2S)-binding protein [Paracoccaceae bacterium]